MSNQFLANINVDDITSDDRTALERILGRGLESGQQVMISAYSRGVEPDNEQKAIAAKVIKSLTEKAQENMEKQLLSESEIDSVVDEAIAHARQRK